MVRQPTGYHIFLNVNFELFKTMYTVKTIFSAVDSIVCQLQAFIMNSNEGKEPRQRRERSRERHVAESSEQREARLARVRERRAAESSE